MVYRTTPTLDPLRKFLLFCTHQQAITVKKATKTLSLVLASTKVCVTLRTQALQLANVLFALIVLHTSVYKIECDGLERKCTILDADRG